MRLRTARRLLAVTLLSLALAVPLSASAHRDVPLPTTLALPNGFMPEGITIGPDAYAYFGSRANGDIYAADLRTGEGRVISDGPGTGNPSVGLKSDQRDLLYVSGGNTGTARVINLRTGVLLEEYALSAPGAATFVNDVVLTRSAAWFTDSQQPQLYRVPLGRDGRAADPDEVTRLSLSGEWQQVAGFNANGITQTPDKRGLLVVQSATGYLFRVDPGTGDARRVDLGAGVELTNGDGMLLDGRTLYVVQNRLNQVAVIHLDRTGSRGRLGTPLTSPAFDVPTTVAAFRGGLYLPNARFTTTPTPDTEYSVVRIRQPR